VFFSEHIVDRILYKIQDTYYGRPIVSIAYWTAYQDSLYMSRLGTPLLPLRSLLVLIGFTSQVCIDGWCDGVSI